MLEHPITLRAKEAQQHMYLSPDDYLGKCSCIVCREIKSKKGIHSHYHIPHTELGKVQHKAISARAAQAAGKATQKKFQDLYAANPQYCQHCNQIIPQKSHGTKFCSHSCSATWSNTRRSRNKKPKNPCLNCGALCSRKYCSAQCCGSHRRKYSPDELVEVTKKRNREVSANYRAKLRNQTPATADRKAIREFYKNCPVGYEVDHVIPISKGGLHTLENLQYLTVHENRSKGNKFYGGPCRI